MVTSTRPPRNGFVRLARKVYNPIGFAKGYNFVLWFIFGGALLGFALSRMPMLNFYGVFCGDEESSFHAGPGECWYYLRGDHETVGIIMHLGAIIPGSFLAFFQFVPVIRHKMILFHRVNGYVVIILAVVATVGAFLIGRHAFGGGVDIQVAMGVLGIMFLTSLLIAYINVKFLQIEQHRAWMLRAWVYAGCIITVRILAALMAIIISGQYGYYTSLPCAKIDYVFRGMRNETVASYPVCEAYYTGENPHQWATVKADIMNGNTAESGSAIAATFGAASWLAIALHAIGVEIYLRLTPAEHERLRKISYQRQLEAGMQNPGSAGLTADRLGDSDKWYPREQEVVGDASHIRGKSAQVPIETSE
ncbi:hypothetical protein jhhlp_000752 [Lomentospora prolificans]|uniref:DUF2306 domain-containing protein n=1 Tax=Lomentospora prolificans TaxID=41688 RepID=A0A2N3NJE7_9PEZI|nr:hypothetical protein jhhlp_000752 [Lomentospora prolificans]